MPQPEKMELDLLQDEYWWGGIVRFGNYMPFSAKKEYRMDLYMNLHGNQGCPLLVSSKGRYIWSEEPYAVEFGNGKVSLYDIRSEIFIGEGHGTLKGAYLTACHKFFPPSGKIPHELCFLAPQYNSWIDVRKYPTQEKILKYAHDILDAGMPAGVFMIDDFWYKSNGDWKFDRDKFPNPEEMVDELHKMGFLVMLWISPWVTSDSIIYAELKNKGYLLCEEKEADQDTMEDRMQNGLPVVQSWWNGYSCVLDLSNPEAFAWLQGQLDELTDKYGIDGFKFDGGDPYRYKENMISYAQRTPNGHCEDFGRIGLKYSLSEYRACWKLGGQHLIQRVRDKGHRWGTGGLADTIPTSIAQGLIGYPYTCPDMVGGGELFDQSDFDQELFVRWAQSSTFFPIIQYSQLPNRVLDKEYYDLCMEMIKLRKKIGPEILRFARHAAKTGEPIIRHMAYEFPDAGFEEVIGQYMLGDKYLVAPVLEKGATTKEIRFPEGKWEGDDGSVVTGPCVITVDAPLSRLPWYTRIG